MQKTKQRRALVLLSAPQQWACKGSKHSKMVFLKGGAIGDDFQCSPGTEGATSAQPRMPSTTKHNGKAVHRCTDRQTPQWQTNLQITKADLSVPKKVQRSPPNPIDSVLSSNSLTNNNTVLNEAPHPHKSSNVSLPPSISYYFSWPPNPLLH